MYNVHVHTDKQADAHLHNIYYSILAYIHVNNFMYMYMVGYMSI